MIVDVFIFIHYKYLLFVLLLLYVLYASLLFIANMGLIDYLLLFYSVLLDTV